LGSTTQPILRVCNLLGRCRVLRDREVTTSKERKTTPRNFRGVDVMRVGEIDRSYPALASTLV
jgi:hypothetical protein